MHFNVQVEIPDDDEFNMEKRFIEFNNIPFVKEMSLNKIWKIALLNQIEIGDKMGNSDKEIFLSNNLIDYVAFLNLKIVEVSPKTSIMIKNGDNIKFVYSMR